MTEALVPYRVQTLEDTMTLGKVLAQSGYFADSREAAQAVVKVLAGQELGFGPIASMTGVNIIKGKVSLSANLIAAAIKRSGRYNYRVVTLTDEACRIDFYEAGERIGTSEFTMADAREAGLGGDNWKKFKRNMLFARAISNGAKWYCPDLSGGPLYTPDELGATVDGETGEVIDAPRVVVSTPTMPQPAATDASQDEQTPPLPFAMNATDAVNWAMQYAPQVWPTDKGGMIVRNAVINSLGALRKQDLTGDALALAWIAKVDDKLATWKDSQASDNDGWADVNAAGHDADEAQF